MKRASSQPVIKKLKKQFAKKFMITTEAGHKFQLDDTFYQPDLVLCCKKSKRIKFLIEVEQGSRKHMVGGVISGDYCMGKIKQKPIMIILALKEQDRKDYGKRVPMLKQYIRNLKKLFVLNEHEVIEKLKNLR